MMGSLIERFIFYCVNKAACLSLIDGIFLHFILEIQCWVTFHDWNSKNVLSFDFFRYFFKKRSNEFESEVVFEEISNDDEVLPLWDGKIVAKVDKMD